MPIMARRAGRRRTVALALTQQNTAGTASSATTRTITLPSVSAGHGLVLFIAAYASSGTTAVPVTSIADSAGNTWTRIISDNQASGSPAQGETELWYVGSSAASASTLTVTLTYPTWSANGAVALHISDWTRALTLNSSSQANTAATPASGQNLTVTSATGNLVIVGQNRYDNATATASSPATNLTLASSPAPAQTIQPAYQVATTTSTTFTFGTGASTGISTVGASFTN